MRGDSLRDLYAKALALLGLGLLGVAGALVDYWPVRGELPTVASVFDPPTLPDLPPAPPLMALKPAEPVVSRHAVRRIETPGMTEAAFETAIDAEAANVLETPPAALPALLPPPPPSLTVVAARPDNIPSSTLALMPPVIVAPEAFLSVPPVASPSSGDNMFEGAAKTVGRAGLKTGAAIANGFKAVGHVFRFPF